MNSPRTWLLGLLALLVFSFGLAVHLQPQYVVMPLSRAYGDIFKITLGESRKLFANEFYTKSDAYYHSGFYPTIFDDNAAFKTAHIAEDTGAVSSKNHGEEDSFMGPPRDWIDAFGRHFLPNRHTHLDSGGADNDLGGSDEVREILPWLKLSTDLDPQNVQNYTVAAYWLRQRMNQTNEAFQVLMNGLRHNPGSPDILFELGRLYAESYQETNRARNVWLAAAHNWHPMSGTNDAAVANNFIYEKITTQLGQTERAEGHPQAAIGWFEKAKTVSQTPDALQDLIDAIQKKMPATNAIH